MLRFRIVVPLRLLTLLCLLVPSLRAQSPFTLRTDTRTVLTDVTVTDNQSKPVHGLPASAFEILDNGRPQDIASFTEHIAPATPAPIPASAPNVFTNALILHPPPVFNVIVLDTVNLSFQDQSALRGELLDFFNTLPPGQAIAIYSRSGQTSLLVQDFTSDGGLLASAVNRTIPRLSRGGRNYFNDITLLNQFAIYLRQLPGRKNVLWFSGGSVDGLRRDPSTATPSPALRRTYDALESERVAIYPIDARGLRPGLSQGLVFGQRLRMEETAEATGGFAYHQSNRFSAILTKLLAVDADFYTLSYSPTNFQYDNKWHTVQIRLKPQAEAALKATLPNRELRIAYRTGYFADASNGTPDTPSTTPRTRLLPTGSVVVQQRPVASAPIIFSVRVLPAAQAPIPSAAELPPDHPFVNLSTRRSPRGTVPYSIHYMVPASSVTVEDCIGGKCASIGVSAMTVSTEGTPTGTQIRQVNLQLNPAALAAHPDALLSINLPLDLLTSTAQLHLTLWDVESGRNGAIDIPMQLERHR